MSRPLTTVSLPPARAAQLRDLAELDDSTVVDVLERFINREIEAGRLRDELPGFEVAVEAGHVWLVIDGVGLPPLHPAHARVVADLLDHAASGMKDGRGNRIGLNDGMVLKVGRKGRGILIGLEDPVAASSVRGSMTPSMARDLARQLRTAADRAQNR